MKSRLLAAAARRRRTRFPALGQQTAPAQLQARIDRIVGHVAGGERRL